MAIKNIIRNFVHQYRKPFNTETIAELTGIETKTVRQSIRKLLANNEIKDLITAIGAGVGGLIGAAGGAALGAIIGNPGTGAAIGAAAGGIGGGASQGLSAEEQYKRAYTSCMRQRGHNVIN